MILSTNKFFLLFLFWFLLEIPISPGQNSSQKHTSLYFISDCQEPLPVEKIIRKTHRNGDARDSLFREIENKNDGYVFMLGDLVGKGSKNSEWKGVDRFLKTLRDSGSKVYAIPGNHEYMLTASKGIPNFQTRFPDLPLTGYCVRTDGLAIVMLNSNFRQLTEAEKSSQKQWYMTVMDSLDADSSVQMVIVCTHHSPFSNSKVVGSSVNVQEALISRYEQSPKTKLFISGHSHNLECFESAAGKRFMVIGGGGGIDQPLYLRNKEKYQDRISHADKPRFFYLVLQRRENELEVTVRGFTAAFETVPEIRLSL